MDPPRLIIVLGFLFIAALVLDALGRRVHVPRVTLLILLGALFGPPALNLLPDAFSEADETFTAVALTMVAFLLGGSLERSTLAAHGREILLISLAVVLASLIVVAGVLAAFGVPLVAALALAGISAATDPAATRDVIRQAGRAGRFETNLLGIVAIDDAWGLIAFTVVLTLAGVLAGQDTSSALLHGLWEMGGGALLGLVVGLPAAYLTGRLKPGEPSLLEALAIVLICAGAALVFEVSYLLAGMVSGVLVVNLAKHHDYPFHEIERIEWPFVLVFFVIAGASLEVAYLSEIGFIGVLYVLARMAARLIGGWGGARLAGLSGREGVLTGMALTPQAGVAIGMALLASARFPEYAAEIMAITIASTIVFEVVGPVLAQVALARSQAGEAPTLPETETPR
ncbi:MAG: cation:proton antiporter [Pseudomonadota bacterium]